MIPTFGSLAVKKQLEEIQTMKERKLNEEEFAYFQNKVNSFFKNIFFLVSDIDTFYACVFLKVTRRFDYNAPFPAGVHLENGEPVMILNPLFLINFTIGEMEAIVIHEIYHLLLMHLSRALKNADQDVRQLENIAMDFVVNRSIEKDITNCRHWNVKLPSDSINAETLSKMFPNLENTIQHWKYDNGNYEKYFKILLENNCHNKLKKDREEQTQKFLDQLKNDLEKVKNGEMSPSQFAEKYKNKIMLIPDHSEWEKSGNVESKDGKKQTFKASSEMIKEDLKRLLNQVFQETKGRGNLPSGFEEMINIINAKEKISWQKELTKLVGSVRVPFEKTTRRRSRRLPERLDIPGRRSKKIIKIAVAVDTSGSMSKDEIEKSFIEIFNILKSTNFELTVIECDAAIQRVYTAHDKRDIKLNIMGRGGTSFIPVFEYIKNIKMIEKQPDLLVYFTDGGGDYEIPKNLIPKKTITMWVLTNKVENLSVKNPFGILRELRVHDKRY